MLKRTFKNWDVRSFKTLYCSTVRPRQEYASTAWSPYLKQHIKALEREQRQATKIVRTSKHLPYDQRLKAIGITRLSARRDRGDAIQYFKSKNDYNHIAWYHVNSATNSLESSGPAGGIRGNSHRIIRQLIKRPARNHFFANRVVNNWNSLPEQVIASRTVNSFTNLYDIHFMKANTLL